jgi:hypothetical protein
LGFTPAWVICYTKPGKSEIIKKNIETLWPYKLHLINFELDKFTVDKSITYNYDSTITTPDWTTLPSATSQSQSVTAVFSPNLINVDGDLSTWYVNMPFQLYGTPPYIAAPTSCTITATLGSTIVTGTGTTFTQQVARGSIITDVSNNVLGIVNIVNSDTSLTLTSGATASFAGNWKVQALQNDVTYYVKEIDSLSRIVTISKKLDESSEFYFLPQACNMTAVPLYGQTTPVDSKDFYVFYPQRTILPGY